MPNKRFLWKSYKRTSSKTFCFVSFYQPTLCRQCLLGPWTSCL